MNTSTYQTKSTKPAQVERRWYVIDAENQTLGRMCSRIAHVIRGKHKASYTPHIDTGDHVIVLNAGKVNLSGAKWDQKEYITYSGYPGGQKRATASEVRAKHPIRIIENAVRGMIPKNRLGRAMFAKLHVYEGTEHPHEAQKPEKLSI